MSSSAQQEATSLRRQATAIRQQAEQTARSLEARATALENLAKRQPPRGPTKGIGSVWGNPSKPFKNNINN